MEYCLGDKIEMLMLERNLEESLLSSIEFDYL